MSVAYTSVGWTTHKKIYDGLIATGVVVFVAVFLALTMLRNSPPSIETALIRATGACGLTMLHIVLWIGPLARLDRRFLPLLYNRRHLGVCTFLVGLVHAVLALGYHHGFGALNPLVSLLTGNTRIGSLREFPFEWLGLGALLILFLLAATSHDFWQKVFSPSTWKWLHMSVYLAYALLLIHVALGTLVSEARPTLAVPLGMGACITIGLHVWTGAREWRKDIAAPAPSSPFFDACALSDIPQDRAKVVCVRGRERIAIFRQGEAVSAVGNVCAHQGGPLGEGKIIDGCITCPWHGWQYRPRDGCSPPPFTERIPTYEVRVKGERVEVRLPDHPEKAARPAASH